VMKGNITPGGVKSIVGGAMNMRDQETDSASKLAGAIDSTAGELASAQAAREKAAATKKEEAMGLENGVAFSPSDELDRKILAYMQNPKNDDGSVKSLQQFESELNAEYGNKFSGTQRLYPTDYVSSRIAEKVPKDFIGQEDKYSLMAQGYSAKQAEENAGALRYNQMTPEEQSAWQIAHPQMAQRLSAMGNDPQLIRDIGLETDSEGNVIPKFSIQELQDKYPGIDPKVIAVQAKPVFAKAVSEDIYSNLPGAGDLKAKFDDGTIQSSDYADFLDSDEYKAFKKALIPMYGGVFTDQELDQIVFNSIAKK